MVGQLEVHGGRRALGADLHLEGVQGGLVGFGGQALGQARVDGHEAGSVGCDGTFRCGEVAGQGVGRQVRGCGYKSYTIRAVQLNPGGGQMKTKDIPADTNLHEVLSFSDTVLLCRKGG